jgi:type IV secretory pathway TraG/TraD family ATPase VirD4
MRIWTSPRLQAATQVSDFFFEELKMSMCQPIADNPAPTTLYVVIPPEYLNLYRSVLRTMIGLAAIELTRAPRWMEITDEPWRERPPCPVMFLLDELPALGHMEPIVNGLSYLAGYDVQIWSFVQNIGQLQEIYKEAWHNFPANAAVSCFFGVNDYDTADYVSKQLGKTEEFEKLLVNRSTSQSVSSSEGTTGSLGSGSSYTDSEGTSATSGVSESRQLAREYLAMPAEVRATHKDLQYVFIRNRPPALVTRVDHYKFPLFKGLYGDWRTGD